MNLDVIKPATEAEQNTLWQLRGTWEMADLTILRHHVDGEKALLQDAALTLAATGTLLLRDHALLLPAEQEKWEAACGKLNRVLAAMP
jgi:hypothetical protein